MGTLSDWIGHSRQCGREPLRDKSVLGLELAMVPMGSDTSMTTYERPRQVVVTVRELAGIALLALLSILSLGFPIVTPFVAITAGAVAVITARRTGSRLAWAAFVVCGLVLALGLVIDLGLLPTSTVQIGPVRASTSPR